MGFPDEMCMIGTALRLEEVPEMGYNPLGERACGEICVRGKSVFSGYHKNPELTRESIKDGWFHTERKNLIKLSQGEYVALEHLENVYVITPIVEDIWVYGTALIVIHMKKTPKKWAYSNGHVGSFAELCSLDQLKNYVLAELKFTAERNQGTNTCFN
ncbi:long chain acyl-coa synthetase 1 [Quercus suber]|uniref:Long chain acyl-coa synthetase 1 n=1 Tax=Quercus suber TaxID=58331 RepID=A0AAW0LSI9_QUESU